MSIKQVYFDAGLTLLLPAISPAITYVDIASKYGMELKADIIKEKFRGVFNHEMHLLYQKQQGRFTNDIGRSVWKTVVEKVFQLAGGVYLPEECFEEIYQFYTHPEAWKVAPDALELIDQLKKENIQTGILSNWDYRLRKLIEQLGWEKMFHPIIISSEVGWEKPHSKIYTTAIEEAAFDPEEILMIGDNYENDIKIPQKFGMQAIWYSADERPEAPKKNMKQIANWFGFTVSSSLD